MEEKLRPIDIPGKRKALAMDDAEFREWALYRKRVLDGDEELAAAANVEKKLQVRVRALARSCVAHAYHA